MRVADVPPGYTGGIIEIVADWAKRTFWVRLLSRNRRIMLTTETYTRAASARRAARALLTLRSMPVVVIDHARPPSHRSRRTAMMVLALLLTAGCATPIYSAMSAEQLKELVRDKNATANCVRGLYAGAAITIVYVNADKGLASDIMIDENCKTTMKATTPGKTP